MQSEIDGHGKEGCKNLLGGQGESRRVGRSTKILDLTVGLHSMARVQRAPYRDRLGRKQNPCGWTHATKKSQI